MDRAKDDTSITLGDCGENALVEKLIALLPSVSPLLHGAGDDCAVAPRDEIWDSLLKTDVIVEGIHFLPTEVPERIGHKALARALSDIAAMGGVPEYALVTLLADSNQPLEKVTRIYQGLIQCAEQYEVTIAGGETSSLPHPGLILNIALTGRVARGTALLRSSALPGDIIYVTGVLGGSLAGHHLDFSPRLEESAFLLSTGYIHAMMDLSDGLAKDLPKLAAASNLSFTLDSSALPCRPGCDIEQALGDGEDYELLFTTAPEDSLSLLHQWQAKFPHIPLTPIGKMTPPSAPSQENTPLPPLGWEHFSSQ